MCTWRGGSGLVREAGRPPDKRQCQHQHQRFCAADEDDVGAGKDVPGVRCSHDDGEADHRKVAGQGRFAAITIRLENPRCTALLFTSGKLVITGVKSW
jgi:hypothetical protein